METNIQIFENAKFGKVRTMVMPDGQVGFLGKDVAEALGYNQTDKAISRHVEEDDRMKRTVTDSLGRSQVAYFINESGLYSLILSSKLPKAKEFKHWVTGEVLPQIRMTGGYIPLNENENEDENTLLARALLIAQKTIELKDGLLEEQKPMVQFAKAVTSSEDSIMISEMAKLLTQNGYEIGRTRFFNWLREHGYIFKNSTEPIQKWVERGILDTHVSVVEINNRVFETITTKVTGKGQKYFIDMFLKAA